MERKSIRSTLNERKTERATDVRKASLFDMVDIDECTLLVAPDC